MLPTLSGSGFRVRIQGSGTGDQALGFRGSGRGVGSHRGVQVKTQTTNCDAGLGPVRSLRLLITVWIQIFGGHPSEPG